MRTIQFEHEIQAAQLRLRAMQKLAESSPSFSKDLQNEAIAEFSIILEELHVASEEIKVQNEALSANHHHLELERRRYQELFDFAPDAYFVTDLQGVIQQANHAATALLNLRQDLIVAKPLIVFIDKADQMAFHTQLDQLLQDGRTLTNWEVSFKPRHKLSFPASISVSPIHYDNRGQLSCLHWLVRDLSERKLYERAINEQADLLNTATDAIIVRNLENQIVFWNQGAERLYGWTAQEARDQNTAELLYQNTRVEVEDPQNEAVFLQGEWRGELQHWTKTGQEIIVESRWTLMRNETGDPQSVFIVNTDITAQKQIESQLFQCQREESLGTLARGIAHDLNNILTPILSIAQLMPLKFPRANAQMRRLMTILETSAKRAIDLINQIQLFAVGVESEKKVLLIGVLLSDLEQLIEKVFPKSIALNIDISPEIWCVEGNAVQLNQVFVNLCVNARDAMPQGGVLKLLARNLVIDKTNLQRYPEARLGPYVVITATDNGTGIPPENLDRIFEPFFTTKPEGQGSGLGLSILAGIVRSHGGFITVSSRVDRGSQFEVFLPALKTMVISLEEELTLPRGNAELVLLVDDEATVLESTQLLLENFGYRIMTAKDGVEALTLYQRYQAQISVILLDMMMPAMDGDTAISGLAAINPRVKIVATSGLSLSLADIEPNQKICDFLPKPYTVEKLLTVIQRAIISSL